MDDLISVIVPAYNVEQYIGKCLDSILGQTYPNLEIILIDDGSTDGTGEICEAYRERDSRIIVVHQQNQGALAARNAGIEQAQGKYIGFVDGDDWISEQMYQELYGLLKRYDAEVAVCKKNIYSDTTGMCFAESDVIAAGYYADCKNKDIMHNMFLGQSSGAGISLNLYDKLFSRKLIEGKYREVDCRLRYFEDMALAVLCMICAEGVAFVNIPYYFYRQRECSLCHSTDHQYLEQLNIFCDSVRPHMMEYSKEVSTRLDMFVADRAIYGLNYMMGLNLKNKVPYYIPPFKSIRPDDKVVLYGAGEVGKSFYRFFELTRPGQAVLWVDRQYEKLQREGLQVQDVECLRNQAFDKIIIAVKFRNNAEGIVSSLTEMGIPPEKIIWEQPQTLIDGEERDK
nr:glycosyltransferase family 2 protein [uncultured Acetatifactor sp.]